MTEKELKQSFNKTNYDSVYQKNIKRIIDLLVGIIALPFFIIIFIKNYTIILRKWRLVFMQFCPRFRGC